MDTHIRNTHITLGINLKKLRLKNIWTQKKTAEILNVSPPKYSLIERGKTNVRLSTIYQAANIFEVKIWELFSDTDKIEEKSHTRQKNSLNKKT